MFRMFWGLLAGLFLTGPLYSEEPIAISEPLIKKLANEQNPTKLGIETAFLQAQHARSGYGENFSTRLVASGSYSDSSEKAIAAFFPIFAPATELSLGLERPFKWGVNTSLSAFTSQQSTTSGLIDRATRTGVRAGLSFDLWKNIGGRLDRAMLDSLEASESKAKLQAEIDLRALELNLRKVFWALVANRESIKVSEKLLAVSQEQLKEAKRRLRASISDKGTVARYGAQVASRKARLSSLEYQQRNLIESLQSQLPMLSDKKIELAEYSVEKKVAEVLECTAKIRAHKKVPWEYTNYDELINLVNEAYQKEQTVTSAHNSPDLQLSSQIQLSGVDQGYTASFDDFAGSGRVGYQLGLKLTVPIGSAPASTERIKEAIDKKRAVAEKEQLSIRVKAKHQQISEVIEFLYNSLRQLEENTANLRTSVEQMERKYKQARVSAFELIAEQDVLQSSLLAEIETKLNVIHILYDYFQIFTDFPCETNHLGVRS